MQGKPITAGVTCADVDEESGEYVKEPNKGGDHPRPDFVISPYPPNERIGGGNKNFRHGWLIGDVKRSTKGLYNSYIKGSKKQIDQFYAITRYSKKHTYGKHTIFIVLVKTKGSQYKTTEALVHKKARKEGCTALVGTVLGGGSKRGKK